MNTTLCVHYVNICVHVFSLCEHYMCSLYRSRVPCLCTFEQCNALGNGDVSPSHATMLISICKRLYKKDDDDGYRSKMHVSEKGPKKKCNDINMKINQIIAVGRSVASCTVDSTASAHAEK